MAQLFRPAANSIATASLLVGATLPVVALFSGSQITRSPANTKVLNPVDQPVPFSHKHHVKELGIDCRYCHSTVEEQANATVPSSEVCMSCHSQVWTNSPMLDPVRTSYETDTPLKWNKVNVVPDFVYFDHSIHIAKGISCNNCHGAVQEMHITWKGQAFRMAWCLDCHKDPAKFMLGTDGEQLGAAETAEDHGHEEGAVNAATPKEQIFAIYQKIAAGEKLTPQEYRLSRGQSQLVPKDDIHKGYGEMRMEDREIKKEMLSDCYVCHN